jgi:hypothetical protein
MTLSQADLIGEYDSLEKAERGMELLAELEPDLREDLGVFRFENGKPVGQPVTFRVYA